MKKEFYLEKGVNTGLYSKIVFKNAKYIPGVPEIASIIEDVTGDMYFVNKIIYNLNSLRIELYLTKQKA